MSEQKEMVDSLRMLANWLESREFDLSDAGFSSVEVTLFCHNGNSFLNNTKKMGAFRREFTDYSAQLVKRFGNNLKFILFSSRDNVCERVKIGVEVVPAEPERIIPAKPERVVDKFEYKCPESLLKEE